MTFTAPEGGRRTLASGVPRRSCRTDRLSRRSSIVSFALVGIVCATVAGGARAAQATAPSDRSDPTAGPAPIASTSVPPGSAFSDPAKQAATGQAAGAPHPIAPYTIASHAIASHHVAPRHVAPRHVASGQVAPGHVASGQVALSHISPSHLDPVRLEPETGAHRGTALAQVVAPNPGPRTATSLEATAAAAAPPDAFRLSYAPHAWHRSQSDDHVKWNNFIGVEYATARWTFWRADRALVGFAAGDNSFGQFSQYAYFGQEWDLWRLGPGRLFANVTAGLLHGYKDEHRDKIPLNGLGIAPVIIPGAGWRVGRFAVGGNLLGANGVMFFGSVAFDLR